MRIHFGSCCEYADSVLVQADGKVVAVGFQATNSNKWAGFAAARYVATGAMTGATAP